jgi:cyanobactin maturation PatA/PatG family protease
MSHERSSETSRSRIPTVTALPIPGLAGLWAESTGDPRVVIAVLDGPVDRAHPALFGSHLTAIEVVVPSVPRRSGQATRHGTLAASMIFGRHESGSLVAGMSPECRGILVPIFKDSNDSAPSDGPFQPYCSQLDLARAILTAAENGANIINISGGQFAPTSAAHPILTHAVAQCVRGGILIVAAAGNDGCECLHVPAALPGVLAVGAMDSHGQPLETSNWGPSNWDGGILALGTGLVGAIPGGATSVVSGTSFATALVSGVAGLLWSVALQYHRPVNGARIRDVLLDSAQKCFDDTLACRRLLGGRLDLVSAGSLLRGTKRHDGYDLSTRPSSSTERLREDRENGKIFLDSRKSQIDDLNLWYTGGLGSLSVSRRAGFADSGELRMSDEIIVNSASAEFPLPRPIAGSESRGSGGSAIAAQWESTPGLSPAESSTPGCGCASCQAKETAGSKSCGCASCRGNEGAGVGGLVFCLGAIGFDLGTESRRDSIRQHMTEGHTNPLDPAQMLAYLDKNPWEATSIVWTLSLDQTPIYAIHPSGPFAAEGYRRLREFLADQLAGSIERVSIPGRVAGRARLFSGQVLPVVVPELRGMYSWTTDALMKAVAGNPPAASASAQQKAAHSEKVRGVRGFLDRIYHEHRNLGVTAEERAINYVATNVFQIQTVYESALKESMELDSIEVERSSICRSDSDCWDVKIYFFYPQRQVQTVRQVHRSTVDVSDVVPVTVGPVRSWFVR